MKEIRFLYETKIKRQIEEVVVDKKVEGDTTTQTKRTVTKVKEVKVAILKPDRKLFKGAELFYAKTLSEYLKSGLLPYSLVAKRYANDGGPLTEREKERLRELREQARELEKDFFGTQGDDEIAQERKNELLVQINATNAEISTIQNAYSDIFDSTAEMKSRNDTIEWWSLFLIYWDEDGKGYKPLFGDGQYDARVESLEEYEDKAEPFFVELIKRLSYLISFWFTARDTVSQIDFSMMENLWTKTLSTYKVEETVEETVSVEEAGQKTESESELESTEK